MSLIPFLPLPPPSPPKCACGEPLEMEHERDACECVECAHRRSRIHPVFAQLLIPFSQPVRRPA